MSNWLFTASQHYTGQCVLVSRMNISSLSCQNLITSIFAENELTVVHIVLKYCTPKPIRTGLKRGSNPHISQIYDISRDKKFKSPFFTFHPEIRTMNLHTKKDIFFSPNNILCVPLVFLPIKIENNYLITLFT